MINVNIGHASVKVRDKEYLLIPSLSNISKIGTPQEIVECFNHVTNPIKFSYRLENGTLNAVSSTFAYGFDWACRILNCCGLPESITGWVVLKETDEKYPYLCPVEGKIGFNDVFVLAAHCLKHGVCGVVKEQGKGEPIKDFDAHFYIHLAHKALDISLSEAASLTMTEFSMLMEAEKALTDGSKTQQAELRQQNNAFDWYNKKKRAD